MCVWGGGGGGGGWWVYKEGQVGEVMCVHYPDISKDLVVGTPRQTALFSSTWQRKFYAKT